MIHTSEIKNFVQFAYHVIINDVNICDDTHHLNAILKTGPRATNVVLAGDLVPAGTVLATPALYGNLTLTLSIKNFGVYPISLLSDLFNVDYAVQIAVLTTKYKYVQHKYAK